jgi:hypothetical protein
MPAGWLNRLLSVGSDVAPQFALDKLNGPHGGG